MKSYSAQTQDVLREDKGEESYSAESHNSSDVKEKVLKSNKYENYPRNISSTIAEIVKPLWKVYHLTERIF